MKQSGIVNLKTQFDSLIKEDTDSKIQFWYARDLMLELGYTKWRNFMGVIEKAKTSCNNAGIEIKNHFVGVNKMVDPRKDEIAFAQTYFALQTRKQEIIEEHLELQDRLKARQKLTESETELSKNIYERGVDDSGFGRIRSKGDQALFGGHTT